MLEILIIWNAVVFVVYGTDKLLAIKNCRRISEKTLLTMAFGMGGVGAYLGMYSFRHKTRKIKFTTLVPIAVLFNAALVYLHIK